MPNIGLYLQRTAELRKLKGDADYDFITPVKNRYRDANRIERPLRAGQSKALFPDSAKIIMQLVGI